MLPSRSAGQESKDKARDAAAVEKLEQELERERQRRLRAEEDIKNLVDDMHELAGSSESADNKTELDAERVARQRAEAALETMVRDVEELKEGHAQRLQAVLHQLHGLLESSSLQQDELQEQREKRQQAEEVLDRMLGEVRHPCVHRRLLSCAPAWKYKCRNSCIHASVPWVEQVEQLREGNTMQMKKVGAEFVKLQKNNSLQLEQLQRMCKVLFQSHMHS